MKAIHNGLVVGLNFCLAVINEDKEQFESDSQLSGSIANTTLAVINEDKEQFESDSQLDQYNNMHELSCDQRR